MYLFNPKNNCFYPYSIKESYVKSGTWPVDGVDVDQQTFDTYTSIPPDGKTLGHDNNDLPVWIDIPPEPNSLLLSREISSLASIYKDDIYDLNTAYLAAIVNDGPSEVTKQQIVRDQITQRKAQYVADIAAAKEKYPI